MPSRAHSDDAFRELPHVHLNQKHLEFNKLNELPDSYAWTLTTPDDYPSGDVSTKESVPIIDLKCTKAVRLIGHACKTWGVFQVTNHGIPTRLLDNIENAGKSLFSLPLQQKLKAARSPGCVPGYGVARISSFFTKKMWSEGFTISGPPLDHARKLWPQDYTKFCEIIEEYEKEMKRLAARLLLMILGSLGITKEDMKWAGPKGEFEEACAVLQLNSYPACPDPERAMGLAAHTDSTLLTILYQNNTSGLQVLREGTGWITVPPLPGTLVINIGDLLHMLSNGLYPSVLHRAVVNKTRHRLSVAYLYGPPSDVHISPLQKLIGPGQPPLYRSITWSEYLGTKAKHFNKALSSVRLWAPLNGLVDVKDHNSVKVF